MRLSHTSSVVVLAVASLLAACSGPAQSASLGPEVVVTSTARSTCESIEIACDPYEQTSSMAKACHDFSYAPTTTEAMCIARRDDCLTACQPSR